MRTPPVNPNQGVPAPRGIFPNVQFFKKHFPRKDGEGQALDVPPSPMRQIPCPGNPATNDMGWWQCQVDRAVFAMKGQGALAAGARSASAASFDTEVKRWERSGSAGPAIWEGDIPQRRSAVDTITEDGKQATVLHGQLVPSLRLATYTTAASPFSATQSRYHFVRRNGDCLVHVVDFTLTQRRCTRQTNGGMLQRFCCCDG